MWPARRLAHLPRPGQATAVVDIPSPARSERAPVVSVATTAPDPGAPAATTAAAEPALQAEPGPTESQLTLSGARVEIRALWGRLHELEFQVHLMVHAFEEVLHAIQTHG